MTYRRVALYGIDFLIEQKVNDFNHCGSGSMTEDIIRKREEIAEQVKALKGMKKWLLSTDMTFLNQLKMLMKHSNGYTLDT